MKARKLHFFRPMKLRSRQRMKIKKQIKKPNKNKPIWIKVVLSSKYFNWQLKCRMINFQKRRSRQRSQMSLSKQLKLPLTKFRFKFRMECKSRAIWIMIIKIVNKVNNRDKMIKKIRRIKVILLISNNLRSTPLKLPKTLVSISLSRIPRRKITKRKKSNLHQNWLILYLMELLLMLKFRIPRLNKSKYFNLHLILRLRLHRLLRGPQSRKKQ